MRNSRSAAASSPCRKARSAGERANSSANTGVTNPSAIGAAPRSGGEPNRIGKTSVMTASAMVAMKAQFDARMISCPHPCLPAIRPQLARKVNGEPDPHALARKRSTHLSPPRPAAPILSPRSSRGGAQPGRERVALGAQGPTGQTHVLNRLHRVVDGPARTQDNHSPKTNTLTDRPQCPDNAGHRGSADR